MRLGAGAAANTKLMLQATSSHPHTSQRCLTSIGGARSSCFMLPTGSNVEVCDSPPPQVDPEHRHVHNIYNDSHWSRTLHRTGLAAQHPVIVLTIGIMEDLGDIGNHNNKSSPGYSGPPLSEKRARPTLHEKEGFHGAEAAVEEWLHPIKDGPFLI